MEEVDENASDDVVELLLFAPMPKNELSRRFIGIPGAIDFLRPAAAEAEELVEAEDTDEPVENMFKKPVLLAFSQTDDRLL